MIDKSKRKATVERSGTMVVVRMTGGPDCLWLNMYLDTVGWQMTCDSDIGSYSYHWGKQSVNIRRGFVDFCIDWLSDEQWLLRKCIGERHVEKDFDAANSRKNLWTAFMDGIDEDDLVPAFKEVLDAADGYSQKAETWAAALETAADANHICLPEEWYDGSCLVEDYTPWQKRFAEICREVVVPALLTMRTERC